MKIEGKESQNQETVQNRNMRKGTTKLMKFSPDQNQLQARLDSTIEMIIIEQREEQL